MNSISVRAELDYEVIVGGNWREFFAKVAAAHKKILVVAPSLIAERGELEALVKSTGALLFISPDGESQKDYATVERLWTILGQEEFGRDSAIIAIGGGATTDLAGFVAATWLRGVSWYAIPTTLAGMVDASVGGKTGINTASGKNLVGSFYSPRAVCADLEWLTSLSERDFSAGLAEVIKTGFIRDLSILDLLESADGVSGARERSLELVSKSVAVKADVVSADFKEGKLREILNFGHTLGHAIEKHANYTLRHGEAVSIGLHFAAHLSEGELGLGRSEVERLTQLLAKFDLPISIDPMQFPFADLLSLMAGDKKSRDGRIRFVGLVAAGEPGWIEGASPDLLERTYEKILK
jgi:3-dehydroquinate synthase